MKKLLFGLIATVILSTVSFGQKKLTTSKTETTTSTGLVANTPAEDPELSTNDQIILDNINAAIASLDQLKLDNPNYLNYESIVHFTIGNDGILKSNSAVSLMQTNNSTSKRKSCQVCGLRSAYKCLDLIKASNLGNDYDIHVHNDGGGCVTLSW